MHRRRRLHRHLHLPNIVQFFSEISCALSSEMLHIPAPDYIKVVLAMFTDLFIRRLFCAWVALYCCLHCKYMNIASVTSLETRAIIL